MEENATPFETLKQILRHVRNPELLDTHPWTRCLIVQEVLTLAPQLAQASPGQQLVSAIASIFPQLQPAAPPRRGKRLDPRWGEFGLLAALYFTPFNHGTSYPTSLLDAWSRIDPAILYAVYGKPCEALSEEEIKRYELVGCDLEFGSASTLSDWHKKGLQRFTEILLNRERFLSRTSANPSVILNPDGAEDAVIERSFPSTASHERKAWSVRKRVVWISITLFLITALGLIGFKASKIYGRARLVYQDVNDLRDLVRPPLEVETANTALPVLTALQSDLSAFEEEARPALWLGPKLSWIPVYGSDLASAPALIELAERLLNASMLSVQAAQPLLNEFDVQGSSLDPDGLTALLVQAQPRLEEAREELDQALMARGSIDADRLSPRLQSLLVDEVDPVLELADESLSLAMTLPGLLGAGSDGPKTYMLLVQNEDELRPTGGFITSVGNLVLHKGRVIDLEFESVDDQVQEDWSKPYPSAPWQLEQYMNSRVLILRDANWFTDFPTTASWVEYLYAYTHSHSVDGIIAFDQRFLVMLLGGLGPLEVEGAPYPLTDQNVIDYMRQAKFPPAGETAPIDWDRKKFIGNIAEAILQELSNGQSHDWRAIASALSQALAERHLLLQFDDPFMAKLANERGWDNAVRAGAEDYLLVTDTNIGFNKTNAVVEVSLSYDVDLSNLSAPESTLTVNHKNNASQDVPCIHWDPGQKDSWYPINRCYWSYLRVYKQAGVDLLEATPHAIPGDWMLLGQGVPARVDELDEELQGVQGVGTLLVVPGGQSVSTSFTFSLPDTVLSLKDVSDEIIYRLKVQKQPGTLAIPIAIRIHLPNRAVLKSVSAEPTIQNQHLLVNTTLRTDVELEVVFAVP